MHLDNKIPPSAPIELQSFTLSRQEGAATNKVARTEFTIDTLRHFVEFAPPVSQKLDSRALIGGVFAKNIRNSDNLIECTALTLDYDKPLDTGHLERACTALDIAGIAYVGFNSYSNHGRFALIIPFNQPTDRNGRDAALRYVKATLDTLGGFSSESEVAEQLRFISPNPSYQRKVICSGPTANLLNVAQPDATVAPVIDINSRRTVDTFELLSEQASPTNKALYIEALKSNCISSTRTESYLSWAPLLFATFRAFAFGVPSDKLTQEQETVFEVLEQWCRANDGYVEGSLAIKLKDYLRNPNNSNPLHIGSILKLEVDRFKFREHLSDNNELLTAYNNLVGEAPTVAIDPKVLEAANRERDHKEEERIKQELRAFNCLHDLPTPTPRAVEFKSLLTNLITQGQKEAWQLEPDVEWEYFLHPVPVMLGIMQVAALGYTNILFKGGPNLPPKALNIYSLNIAKAGTGKSAAAKLVEDVLAHTQYRVSLMNSKLYSDTGLWLGAFERAPQCLFINEEAEQFFGKGGQIDQNRAGLQSMLKVMFDEGIPGRLYRPSSQVQKTLKEINGPFLCCAFSATPTLLQTDVSDYMFRDGLISRMFVSIDSRPTELKSKAEEVHNRIEAKRGNGNNTDDQDIKIQMAHLLTSGWGMAGTQLHAPKTPSEPLCEAFQIEFAERSLETTRYIMYAEKDFQEASEIEYETQARWVVPTNLGEDVATSVESLRIRAVTKTITLAAVLTLISNPEALHIDIEYLRWASDFQYNTEYGFYKFLLSRDSAFTLSNKFMVDDSKMGKLRPALIKGGPLFKGEASSSELNAFSRPWRRVVSALNKGPDDPSRKSAEALLSELNVGYRKGLTTGKVFFVMHD